MPSTIAQKLKVRADFSLLTINAPPDFKTGLGELPVGVKISSTTKKYNQVHWFVYNKAQMEAELSDVLALLKPGVICWIYYPKRSSKNQTDLTRDKGWEALLQHIQLQWISLISFNQTWSAFGLRLITDSNTKKPNNPSGQLIFQYIDPIKKTVQLPDDFKKLLQSHQSEKAFFDSLSFTNRKEYLEWIITAKREETRAGRLEASIERLGKGWKNPANR